MIELTRILCPVDLSEPSRRALDHAVAIARWYGASITVLRVVPPLMPIAADPGQMQYAMPVLAGPDLDRLRSQTAEFAAHEAGGPPMDTVVVEGDIAGEIAEHARSLPAGLIVMGTHGHRGFERLMLGSVTERVLRGAPCPVLTVPPAAPDAVPAAPGLFKHILCGVDFSPASMRALSFAASLAKEADARLIIAHAVEHIAPWPLPAGAPDVEWLENNAFEAARRALAEAVPAGVREFAQVDEVVISGKPYKVLLEIAESRRADLIVVGAHGGGSGLLHFGSTTNQLVRAAACPVLTLGA